MKRADVGIGVFFLLSGIYLVASAQGFPPGLGRLPGAGFFPGLVGAVMAVLASGLLAAALRRGSGEPLRVENRWALAATVGLLAACLLAWGSVSFPLRTGLALVLYLRLLGERWRTSVAVAAVLTLGVLLAFQHGLRVDLH